MLPRPLHIGEIVQISPRSKSAHGNPQFAGCLMVVSEPKSWGAQGYVTVPAGGLAYYRCRFEDMEPTGGFAPWISGED